MSSERTRTVLDIWHPGDIRETSTRRERVTPATAETVVSPVRTPDTKGEIRSVFDPRISGKELLRSRCLGYNTRRIRRRK